MVLLLLLKFNLNNKVTSDKEEIVNKFNEYFVNIGPTLADKIPPSTVGHKSFLEGDYKDSFSLFQTSPEEIKDIVVTHMKTKRSADFDNVSFEIIKLSIKNIAESLSHLVNNSFMSG